MESAFAAVALAAAAFFLFKNNSSNTINEGEPGFAVDTSNVNSSDWENNAQLPDLYMGTMTLSDNGIRALKYREAIGGKFSPFSYPDFKGRSIGFGHLIKSGESFDEPISEDVAESLFENDISWAIDAVNNSVKVAITQNQFDALVSFAFNVGAGGFAGSTLVKKLNAGDTAAAAEQFSRWIYTTTNGVKSVSNALVSRREAEVNQFLA